MGLHRVTGDDKGLQGLTRIYTVFQGVRRGYRRLQEVTGGDQGLQGVRKGYSG